MPRSRPVVVVMAIALTVLTCAQAPGPGEKWVELEFTVDVNGRPTDIRPIRWHPNEDFNEIAVREVSKWKYNPKIEDGRAVAQPGVKVRLNFGDEPAS